MNDFTEKAKKLLEFSAAHPELGDALAMWQVSPSILAITNPEAAELLAKEMPEFKG